MTITDPAHVAAAKVLREQYQRPRPAPDPHAGLVRDLAEYDRGFGPVSSRSTGRAWRTSGSNGVKDVGTTGRSYLGGRSEANARSTVDLPTPDPARPDAAEHRPRPAAESEPNPPLRSPIQSVWVASFSSVAMASFSSVVDRCGRAIPVGTQSLHLFHQGCGTFTDPRPWPFWLRVAILAGSVSVGLVLGTHVPP